MRQGLYICTQYLKSKHLVDGKHQPTAQYTLGNTVHTVRYPGKIKHAKLRQS